MNRSDLVLAASGRRAIGGYAALNGGASGGEGGAVVRATTRKEITHEALCSRARDETPVIFHVEGTINHRNTVEVLESCNTADDKSEIKEVSNVSIIGIGDGAFFDELGMQVRNASNTILQNLHVHNVKKSCSRIFNGGDAIGVERGRLVPLRRRKRRHFQNCRSRWFGSRFAAMPHSAVTGQTMRSRS